MKVIMHVAIFIQRKHFQIKYMFVNMVRAIQSLGLQLPPRHCPVEKSPQQTVCHPSWPLNPPEWLGSQESPSECGAQYRAPCSPLHPPSPPPCLGSPCCFSCLATLIHKWIILSQHVAIFFGSYDIDNTKGAEKKKCQMKDFA